MNMITNKFTYVFYAFSYWILLGYVLQTHRKIGAVAMLFYHCQIEDEFLPVLNHKSLLQSHLCIGGHALP